MKDEIDLAKILATDSTETGAPVRVFALLALGVVESLASGALSAADAVHIFFNARNGLFVRKQLHDATADAVMGRGVQLPDLYEALSEQDAQREFHRELTAIRDACLRLLAVPQAVA